MSHELRFSSMNSFSFLRSSSVRLSLCLILRLIPSSRISLSATEGQRESSPESGTSADGMARIASSTVFLLIACALLLAVVVRVGGALVVVIGFKGGRSRWRAGGFYRWWWSQGQFYYQDQSLFQCNPTKQSSEIGFLSRCCTDCHEARI